MLTSSGNYLSLETQAEAPTHSEPKSALNPSFGTVIKHKLLSNSHGIEHHVESTTERIEDARAVLKIDKASKTAISRS